MPDYKPKSCHAEHRIGIAYPLASSRRRIFPPRPAIALAMGTLRVRQFVIPDILNFRRCGEADRFTDATGAGSQTDGFETPAHRKMIDTSEKSETHPRAGTRKYGYPQSLEDRSSNYFLRRET